MYLRDKFLELSLSSQVLAKDASCSVLLSPPSFFSTLFPRPSSPFFCHYKAIGGNLVSQLRTGSPLASLSGVGVSSRTGFLFSPFSSPLSLIPSSKSCSLFSPGLVTPVLGRTSKSGLLSDRTSHNPGVAEESKHDASLCCLFLSLSKALSKSRFPSYRSTGKGGYQLTKHTPTLLGSLQKRFFSLDAPSFYPIFFSAGPSATLRNRMRHIGHHALLQRRASFSLGNCSATRRLEVASSGSCRVASFRSLPSFSDLPAPEALSQSRPSSPSDLCLSC